MCSLLKVQFINVFILHFYLPVLAFSSLGKIQSYVMLNHFKMKIWAANIDNYNIWFEFHHTICKADQEWLLEVASPPLLIPHFFAIFLKFCLPIKNVNQNIFVNQQIKASLEVSDLQINYHEFIIIALFLISK